MNIFLGNLAYTATAHALRQLFEPYGAVDKSKVITDRDTGRSKGFGCVEGFIVCRMPPLTQHTVAMLIGRVGTWTAAGVGRFTGQGTAVSYRGASYFQTVPQKLARLNQVAVLYEWAIDAQGNARTPFWEWKERRCLEMHHSMILMRSVDPTGYRVARNLAREQCTGCSPVTSPLLSSRMRVFCPCAVSLLHTQPMPLLRPSTLRTWTRQPTPAWRHRRQQTLLRSAVAASADCMAPPRRRPMQTVHAQHATLCAVSDARFVCGTTAQGLGSPRRTPVC